MFAARPPVPLTAFIGRAGERATARRLIEQAGARLITLTGPGGVGKTRLALQLAADLAPRFGDGVYFVSLAAVSEAGLVLSTLAQALGLRQIGAAQPLERLKNHLLYSRALLVLDNFEQVTGAGPELVELLLACPELVTLVTSRARLHLSGEHELPVPPLGLPRLAPLPEPAELAHCEAVQLFVQRASATQPNFQLKPDNAAAVAALCARLEGLPLALELAAARIKLLPPDALLTRLDRRLPLLVNGAQDLPERQRSLRSTMAWSYALLDAGEQRLFRRLAVFEGGALLEAAEAATNLPGEPRMDVLARAASLADKSLLAPQAAGEPRLAMLETVQEYALEQLEQAGEMEGAHQAHARFFFEWVAAAEPKLISPEQGRWLDRLEREHDNLRAALGWALAHGQAAAALGACGVLWQFWFARGYLSEGRRWLAQALAAAGDDAAAVVRAKALAGAATLATFQADYETTITLGAQALQLFRELDIAPGVAASLGGLAFARGFQGQYDEAAALAAESLAISQTLGNPWEVANALRFVGFVDAMRANFAAARTHGQAALDLFRQLGDPGGSAFMLFALGFVALSQGHYGDAQPLLEQSLALLRPLDDKRSVVMSLVGLSEIALERHDTRAARAMVEEALAVQSEVGDRWFLALSLENSAAVALAEQRAHTAARLLGAAEALRAAIGAPPPLARRSFHEHLLAALRSQLDGPELQRAWAEGGAQPAEQALAEWAAPAPAAPGPDALTARELEVLRLLATGLTNAQIAERLVVSHTTINAHLRNIYGKLDVTSRTAATRFALDHHLL